LGYGIFHRQLKFCGAVGAYKLHMNLKRFKQLLDLWKTKACAASAGRGVEEYGDRRFTQDAGSLCVIVHSSDPQLSHQEVRRFSKNGFTA
jgi:hypothetical protein